MLGVVMEESGITKVVQIRLDDDIINGKASFEADDDFVEEDVEPEEGIVIPPRPPRREHNPDGSLKVPETPEPTVDSEDSTETSKDSAEESEKPAEISSADSENEKDALEHSTEDSDMPMLEEEPVQGNLTQNSADVIDGNTYSVENRTEESEENRNSGEVTQSEEQS